MTETLRGTEKRGDKKLSVEHTPQSFANKVQCNGFTIKATALLLLFDSIVAVV